MAKSKYGRWDLDTGEIVSTCLDRLRGAETDRSAWMEARRQRYVKLRGFLPDKDAPAWPGASNAWMPMLMQNSLRLKAQLYNAVMGTRPIMTAKSRQRIRQDAGPRIDRLQDYQLFVEGHAEQALDDFITQFVDDGTAVAFVRWVFEEQTIYDTRIFPVLAEGMAEAAQLLPRLAQIFPQTRNVTRDDMNGDHWTIEFTDEHAIDRTATADIEHLPDGRIEILLAWKGISHEGPVVLVDDLEDLVMPVRCGNLQPPGATNPHGAPWVYRKGMATLDEIQRRREEGTYDLLDDAGMEAVRAGRPTGTSGEMEQSLKQEKDTYEGRASGWTPSGLEESREILECYERWDINGDGLEEDVIFWIARESQQLCRVRLLSALYPGLPVRRPFAEARFISEVNRFYGISLLELLESIYDLSKVMLDQGIDFGTIRNLPFGFYRPSSGLKQEEMRIIPGEFYPLDDPQRDVVMPQWGNENTAWHLNMLAMLQTFGERVSMVSDVQLGRVPTGKASALRTMGTTMALLGQSDVRGEQILRRLYSGLSQIYQMVHRLNRRYLPDVKEVRIVGAPAQGEEAYLSIERESLDVDIDFEFSAALLNANKQNLAQNLQAFMTLAVSPLALQAGLVTPVELYALLRGLGKALDLDPDRYLKPPAQARGEHLTAEEVLSILVTTGTIPEDVQPLEAADAHLARLQSFIAMLQSQGPGDAGLQLTAGAQQSLRGYVQRLRAQEQAIQQQAIMAAMAAGGGQQTGITGARPGSAPGPGGVATAIAPPPMQTAQPNRPLNGGGPPE